MIQNKPTVAILMATYNGEKYLSEQIDSILNQRQVNVHLYHESIRPEYLTRCKFYFEIAQVLSALP